jgi:hypothetical protein
MGAWGKHLKLRSIIKYRKLERDGVFVEILEQLQPDYNEDLDELRVPMPIAPHGEDALSMTAEWRLRSTEENNRWTEHCKNTRDFLGEKMVLLGKVHGRP